MHWSAQTWLVAGQTSGSYLKRIPQATSTVEPAFQDAMVSPFFRTSEPWAPSEMGPFGAMAGMDVKTASPPPGSEG